jgi:branched-chain amino acid transport system ATP-binding protein
MLAIGRALMASPKLLVLDEPSLGLAPLIVRDIFRIIQEIRSNGTTVLIVEQNAMQTLKIADFAYVLQVGTMVKSGKAEELRSDPELVEAYLGK